LFIWIISSVVGLFEVVEVEVEVGVEVEVEAGSCCSPLFEENTQAPVGPPP
jgi:hypothetical protein